jgi:hypothetical protein
VKASFVPTDVAFSALVFCDVPQTNQQNSKKGHPYTPPNTTRQHKSLVTTQAVVLRHKLWSCEEALTNQLSGVCNN